MELELGLDPDDAAATAPAGTARAAEERPGAQPRRSGSSGTTAPIARWRGRASRWPSSVRCGGWSGCCPMARPGRPALPRRCWRPVAIAAALGQALPEPLVPVAAFEGRATSRGLATEQGPVGMTLLNGTVRAVTAEHRSLPCAARGRARGGAAAGDRRWPARSAPRGATRQPGRRGLRCRLGRRAAAAAGGRARTARRAVGGRGVRPCRRPSERRHPVLRSEGGRVGGTDRSRCTRCASRFAGCARRSRCSGARWARPTVEAADRGPEGTRRKAGTDARLGRVRDRDRRGAGRRAFPAEQRLRRLLAAAERRQRACHDELRSFLDSVEFRRLGSSWPALPAARRQAVAETRSRPTSSLSFRGRRAAQAAEASCLRSTTISPASNRPRCTRSACAPNGCAMQRRSSPRCTQARRRIASSAG